MTEFYKGLQSPGATYELLFGGKERFELRVGAHGEHKLCPVCDGHGGWWFSERKTLWCGCSQCHYSGWVRAGATCIHEWNAGNIIGRCLRSYTCIKCGERCEVDSGD